MTHIIFRDLAGPRPLCGSLELSPVLTEAVDRATCGACLCAYWNSKSSRPQPPIHILTEFPNVRVAECGQNDFRDAVFTLTAAHATCPKCLKNYRDRATLVSRPGPASGLDGEVATEIKRCAEILIPDAVARKRSAIEAAAQALVDGEVDKAIGKAFINEELRNSVSAMIVKVVSKST